METLNSNKRETKNLKKIQRLFSRLTHQHHIFKRALKSASKYRQWLLSKRTKEGAQTFAYYPFSCLFIFFLLLTELTPQQHTKIAERCMHKKCLTSKWVQTVWVDSKDANRWAKEHQQRHLFWWKNNKGVFENVCCEDVAKDRQCGESANANGQWGNEGRWSRQIQFELHS